MGCSSSVVIGDRSSVVQCHLHEPAFADVMAKEFKDDGLCPHSSSDNKDRFHGQFVLVQRLGRGASATVYAVEPADVQVDTRWSDVPELAVKIVDLRKDASGEASGEACPTRRSMARKELKMMHQIGHSCNTISMEAWYLESHFVYIVVERASMTLLRYLEGAPDLSEEVLARVFTDMLTGISHVHRRNVVHRDVKPDNFLCFGPESTVKLCDFGLAERLTSERRQLQGIYGSAPFMSPEMLTKKRYDEKTDVWSFASTAYVLLFGAWPYQPLDGTKNAMKAAIVAGVPAPKFRPPSSCAAVYAGFACPALSDGATDFAKSLLVRDPSRRPSAEDALSNAWLQEARCRPAAVAGNSCGRLRAVVCAAKRAGAFTVDEDADDYKWTNLDMYLAVHQERAHGPFVPFRDAARQPAPGTVSRSGSIPSAIGESSAAQAAATPRRGGGRDDLGRQSVPDAERIATRQSLPDPVKPPRQGSQSLELKAFHNRIAATLGSLPSMVKASYSKSKDKQARGSPCSDVKASSSLRLSRVSLPEPSTAAPSEATGPDGAFGRETSPWSMESTQGLRSASCLSSQLQQCDLSF